MTTRTYATLPYYVAVFAAGFCLMTIEITSSRIVAPIIGSSIFTWTSVIGVTLLGLSLGSLVGGVVADRYSERFGRSILSYAFLLAAIAVYLIIPIKSHIDVVLIQSFSISTLSVVVSSVLFLFPAVVLGMLSPLIFKLYVEDVQHIGAHYGVFSGLWSLGSIVGVFVTGFYFIATIGSQGTVSLIAGVLLILFYFFFLTSKKEKGTWRDHEIAIITAVSLAVISVAYGAYSHKQSLAFNVLFQKESAYYDIRVVDYPLLAEYGNNRLLFMDIDSHSIRTDLPTHVFYTDLYPAFEVFNPNIKDIYVVGAGAYTLPINLRKQYPKADITVSELDPAVEVVGKNYFDLGKYHISTDIGDARIQLASTSTTTGKYDLVFSDAYNSFISVPWYLMTREFFAGAKTHVNPGGVFAINFIGSVDGPQAKFYRSVYRTFTEVFPHAYVFAFGPDTTMIQNITMVGINGDTDLMPASLTRELDIIDPSHFLSSHVVAKTPVDSQAHILTDNYAPVEEMMSGLVGSYFWEYLDLYRKIFS